MAFTKRNGKGVFCWSASDIKTFKNIFEEKDLNKNAVVSKMEITAEDGKKWI